MSDAIRVTKTELSEGVWEVRDADTGKVIGFDYLNSRPIED